MVDSKPKTIDPMEDDGGPMDFDEMMTETLDYQKGIAKSQGSVCVKDLKGDVPDSVKAMQNQPQGDKQNLTDIMMTCAKNEELMKYYENLLPNMDENVKRATMLGKSTPCK